MINAILRKGWLWHAISKIRQKLEIFTEDFTSLHFLWVLNLYNKVEAK